MKTFTAIITFACSVFSGQLLAHHSFSMFDADNPMELKGTIREFQWTNPHTWVQLLVTNEDGSITEWNIEGSSPNGLRRRGWSSSTLQAGMKVTLITNPLKSGEPGGSLVNITLPDGTLMGRRLDPND